MSQTTTLTSAERMRRCLERRDHDRIPRHDGYWPETLKRWEFEGLEGGAAEVYRRLGSDVGGVCWSWPVPFPGRNEVLSETDDTIVVLDRMGKTERRWKHKYGTPEHIAFGCDTSAKWFDEYKPALLAAGPSVVGDTAAKQAANLAEAGKFKCLQGVEGFEAMRQLVGDELVLPAMAWEPEWVKDMSATYTDLILQDFEIALAAGAEADAVWVFGDVGYKNGTFFSPKMYRELLWPDHCRICDWAHDRGMKFIYHTDGDVRAFIDPWLEGGWDCLQPLEAKAGMDVRQLSPAYGERLSFFGNIDQVIVGEGDRDAIEHEVVSKLRAGMANRGYAYYSDHSVPPTVSWASYQFVLELLDQHGRYD